MSGATGSAVIWDMSRRLLTSRSNRSAPDSMMARRAPICSRRPHQQTRQRNHQPGRRQGHWLSTPGHLSRHPPRGVCKLGAFFHAMQQFGSVGTSPRGDCTNDDIEPLTCQSAALFNVAYVLPAPGAAPGKRRRFPRTMALLFFPAGLRLPLTSIRHRSPVARRRLGVPMGRGRRERKRCRRLRTRDQRSSSHQPLPGDGGRHQL